MGANLNISIGATVEPLKRAIAGVTTLMSNFAGQMGAQGTAMKAQIDAATKEIEAQLNQATTSFEKFGREGNDSAKKTVSSVTSLRMEIKKATADAFMLSREFGMNSKEALAAQQHAANLKEEMSDLTQRVAAMNPEAKFKALGDAAKGVTGTFGAATGAMQLLGGESEATQAAMAKLQAIMAVTQGLDAIQALPDAFATLKISIMQATASMSTMQKVMGATVIGAIAIGVALIAANWDDVVDSLSSASYKTDELKRKTAEYNEELAKRVADMASKEDARFAKETKYIAQSADAKIKAANQELALATARKAKADEILALTLKVAEAEKAKATALDKYAAKDLSWAGMHLAYGQQIADADFKMKEAQLKYQTEVAEKGKEKLKQQLAHKLKNYEAEANLHNQFAASVNAANAMMATSANGAFQKMATGMQKMSTLQLPEQVITDYAKAMEQAAAMGKLMGSEHTKLKGEVDAANAAMQTSVTTYGAASDEAVLYASKLKGAEAALKKFDAAQQRSKAVTATVNASLQNLAAEGFANLGTALGNLINGGSGFDSFFASMEASIASFLDQLGKGLIAASVATLAFEQLALNPVAGIAAGVAAIALGQVLKNHIAKGPSFAVGRMDVPFDMNANIHKGEMIIPKPFADDLRKGNGMGGGRVQVDGMVRGDNLYLMNQRAGMRNTRVRGRS